MDDETIIFWEPVTYGYYVNPAPNSTYLRLDFYFYMSTHKHKKYKAGQSARYYVNAAPNFILDSVLDLFLKSHNFTEFLPILEQVIMIRK